MGRKIQSLILVLFLLLTSSVSVVLADGPYTSPSYQFNEYSTSPGGGLQTSSSYQAYQSVGDTTVGNAVGTAYQTQNGFNTTTTPFLEAAVASGSLDLGALSTIATAHTTSTFHVRAYLASGYIVQTVGAPPKTFNHTFNSPSSPTASTAGTEQFGINLVANTSPATFGANPSQNPDATFSFGTAATGYNTTNLYKYVTGDTIASSTKSSGETDYTISYIENISNVTPGGIYSYSQNLVVTATY